MENLTDQLVSRGYQLPVHEDLMKYLADENIINVEPVSHSLDKEMQGDWSSAMKAELAQLIAADQGHNGNSGNTTALDQKTLAKIAADFQSGYIMRGRIIKYELGEENSWNPMKKGIIPVITGTTSRAMWGVAESEFYDDLNLMVTGGLIGMTANQNLDSTTISNSSAGWIGAGAGYLSTKSRGNEAQVELRLWVQSPETGNVVWTNRVEVKVKPQTVFADSNAKNLFNIAINKAVSALVEDFTTKIQ
jgi:hypothetical protein